MGVSYEDMPGVLLDTLFPEHFGLPVGEKETEHVLAQFGVYSKRMKQINPKEAKDDSAEKEEEASAEVRNCCQSLPFRILWDFAISEGRARCPKLAPKADRLE